MSFFCKGLSWGNSFAHTPCDVASSAKTNNYCQLAEEKIETFWMLLAIKHEKKSYSGVKNS